MQYYFAAPHAGRGSVGEEKLHNVRRPFTGLMSPLARLLDFLSERYGILFLVSGG